MIEIIEQIGQSMKLPAYREFEPGQIIKLVRTPTSVYCSLSNSTNPFGMVLDTSDGYLVSILYNSASIIRTDCFDYSCNYTVGELIYSNDSGSITASKLHINSIPIAYVEKPPEDSNLLEIRWI